jgi:hypothetical protein
MNFRHYILTFIFLIVSNLILSQDYSDTWDSHYSYFDVNKIVQGNNKIFAAADNAVFVYDVNTLETNIITTVNGLSGDAISTIYYSETYQLLLIGYENGLVEVYNENDGSVLTVVDIINKATIPSDNKRINHFNEYIDRVFISTDYGISEYNLEQLEFGDTYFIGNGGSQVIIKQTAVFGNSIYAAGYDNNGLKKASVDSDNLINYTEWNQIATGNFVAVEAVVETLFLLKSNRDFFKVNPDDTVSLLINFATLPTEVKQSNNKLNITTSSNVYVYDSNFILLNSIPVSVEFPTKYSSSGIIADYVYIGTKNNIAQGKTGFGVLKISLSDISIIEEIHPDGPLLNTIFNIETKNSELWAVFGGYSDTYNFSGGISKSGISHFKNNQWINISYDTISNVVAEPRYLSHIAINPFNNEQVFVSSYYSGLIEVNNNQVIGGYNETNSTIAPFASTINLTLTSLFDREGKLWLMNGRVASPLNRFNDGQWYDYDFTSKIDPPPSNLGFSDIVEDANGNLFIASYNRGILGIVKSEGEQSLKNIFDEEQANLPTSYIRALAIDKQNQLWIGTIKGLRVLYNTSNFFEDVNASTSAIIILEDGIPKELLEQQFISDIIVDGSNNKWIATIGAGVFYFSSNGQETIFHFTKDNSALPSNNINDMALDSDSGIMYFGTDKGLVAFKSGGSETQDELADAYVYPNPVRPGFDALNEKIKIKDISDNVNIKITDIEGNLVAEAESRTNLRYRGYNLEIDGGTAYWNGKNLGNNQVASGVYLIMLSDLDTFETKVLKLMIVR